MNPKVIVINGMATSGKSTFISLCKKYNSRIREISTVDFVKRLAKEIGWDGIKNEKSRRFLSDLKDAMDRYDNISLKQVDKTISKNPDCIYFLNARQPEDISYFVNKYKASTLLIANPRVPNITSNHADSNVFSYLYDYTIVNDGTLEELEEKAKDFLKQLNIC